LGSPFDHLLENSKLKPEPIEYASNVIRLFLEVLGRAQENQVLDLGSTCDENITFFARRLKKLYLCDLLSHLNRDSSKIKAPDQLLQQLDYPPQSFHGILLWNMVEYFNHSTIIKIAEKCCYMLKPGGLLLVFLTGNSSFGEVACRFIVKDEYRVKIELKTDMDPPSHVLNNRELFEILHFFEPLKSYIYKNGLKEHLFRCG